MCLKSQIKSSIHELQKGVPLQARLFLHPWEESFSGKCMDKMQSLNRCIFPMGEVEFSPAAPDLAVKLSHWGGSNQINMHKLFNQLIFK